MNKKTMERRCFSLAGVQSNGGAGYKEREDDL
jgi:hypothetical protein